jgi:hypothetical protein
MKSQPMNPTMKNTDHQKQDTGAVAPKKVGDIDLMRANDQRPSLSLDAERAEGEGMIAPVPEVEGEGSYTATRRYDEGVARSVAEGDAKRLADEAAAALDGPEGDELRRAEKAAKQGHKA